MSLELSFRLRLDAFDLRPDLVAGAEITALFGPSGAGKTMLLRCVAGLTRPSEGYIRLEGRPLYDSGAGVDVPPRERRIGYVFQQYALFPHLSVVGNIAFGIRHLPPADREGRARELLDLVGLEGLAERKPGHLSGGQQQRVALARALAPEPRLLLLDEPFAATDLRIRRRLRAELRRLHEITGTPMLLVTHDLHDVRDLADTLVLLDHGRVVAKGGTARLLSRPLDPFVADLAGELLD